MTNPQPHSRKATTRQIRYLKELAMRTGGSFSYPSSSAEARSEIDRMKARERSGTAERRWELLQVSRDMAEHRGDSASVQASEIDGYGSSATWR
jgi:hypothetical protein